jgi:SAM-dependent methyltransferase
MKAQRALGPATVPIEQSLSRLIAAVWLTDFLVSTMLRPHQRCPKHSECDVEGNMQVRRAMSTAKGMIRMALRFGGRALRRPKLGDLGGTEPISRCFGYDRGTPVDRFYIELFLNNYAADISGHVLEVGDATYSTRFGREITRQDVLHVREHEGASLIADLNVADSLPENTFDSVVLTQTLQFIYDLPTAVRSLRRSLRPGGVALVTAPGISSVDRGEWGRCWFWSLTENSAKRLFEEEFGTENVNVQVYGNVYAATCFLQGLALEEIDRDRLAVRDASYPMIVTIRATR